MRIMYVCCITYAMCNAFHIPYSFRGPLFFWHRMRFFSLLWLMIKCLACSCSFFSFLNIHAKLINFFKVNLLQMHLVCLYVGRWNGSTYIRSYENINEKKSFFSVRDAWIAFLISILENKHKCTFNIEKSSFYFTSLLFWQNSRSANKNTEAEPKIYNKKTCACLKIARSTFQIRM